jgi:methyl-accepting chemotaxis protein
VSILDQATIRTKLIVLVAAMAVVLAGLGAFAINRLSAVSAKANIVATNWLPAVGSLGEAGDASIDHRRLVLQHILLATPQEMASINAQIAEAEANFNEVMKDYEATITLPDERKLFEEVSADWAAYLAALPPVMRLSEAGEGVEASALNTRTARPLGLKLKKSLDALQAYNVEAGRKAANEGAATFAAAWKLICAALAFGFVMSVGMAAMIIRSINSGLNAVTKPMGELAQGHLEVEVPFRGAKTEVGQIADAVQVFKDALIEKKRLDEAGAADAAAKIERGRKLDEMMRSFEVKVGA